MKKRFFGLFFVAFLGVLLMSCSKDNGSPGNGGGYSNTKGTIEFVNTSSNPYTVSVSGFGSFTLLGNHYVEKDYEKGAYIVEVTQQTGYIFYPTEETYHVTVTSGHRSVCSFPQSGFNSKVGAK